MTHGEQLVRPFVTHHTGEHSIRMMGDTPWLCWRHPDGQWVTECKVGGPGLSWHADDRDEEQPDA